MSTSNQNCSTKMLLHEKRRLYCTATLTCGRGSQRFNCIFHTDKQENEERAAASRLTFLSFRRIYRDKKLRVFTRKTPAKKNCFTVSQHKTLVGSCNISFRRERVGGWMDFIKTERNGGTDGWADRSTAG